MLRMTVVPDVRAGYGPFIAQADHFRAKVRIPSERWDDLWQGEHTRAFMAAGVTRDNVLAEIQAAVQAAIDDGETLEDFRKRFDGIIQRHGWPGGAGGESKARKAWRTSVIYHTNLRTSYMAGRWETLKTFPYLRYQHNTVRNPREEHKAWDGKIIATDDPWWQTRYPPNGWGCRCSVTGVSAAQLRVMRGKDGQPDTPPPPGKGDPPPEWAYHVGVADSGRALPAGTDRKWEDLTPGNWQSQGRPEVIQPRPTIGEPLRNVATPDALVETLQRSWGSETKAYIVQGSKGERFDISVNARSVADHLPADRAPLAGYLDDVLGDPDEVYLAFVRDAISGRVALRLRVIRAIEVEGGRTLFAALDARGGQFKAWTIYRRRSRDAARLRQGRLIYARP